VVAPGRPLRSLVMGWRVEMNRECNRCAPTDKTRISRWYLQAACRKFRAISGADGSFLNHPGEQGAGSPAAVLEGLSPNRLSRPGQGSRAAELWTQLAPQSTPKTSPPVKPSGLLKCGNGQFPKQIAFDQCHWRGPARRPTLAQLQKEFAALPLLGPRLISSQRKRCQPSCRAAAKASSSSVLVGAGSRVLLSNHAKPGQTFAAAAWALPGAAPLNQPTRGTPQAWKKRGCKAAGDATAGSGCGDSEAACCRP